jgi:hypothetical protein
MLGLLIGNTILLTIPLVLGLTSSQFNRIKDQ